jgi:hypothetical protein
VLEGRRLVRVLSDCLKWLGFRHGAPIYRAKANFTFSDLKEAQFAGGDYDKAKVTLTTEPEHAVIGMYVNGTCKYEFFGDEEFLADLFGGLSHPDSLDADFCYVVEGLLLELPDPDGRVFATSGAYDSGESTYDPTRVPPTDEDMYLKVLAVVAFDKTGEAISAVVQRIPSPADQILYIPAL